MESGKHLQHLFCGKVSALFHQLMNKAGIPVGLPPRNCKLQQLLLKLSAHQQESRNAQRGEEVGRIENGRIPGVHPVQNVLEACRAANGVCSQHICTIPRQISVKEVLEVAALWDDIQLGKTTDP